MAEHRRIWPLLVYGGLAAIAAARRKETERIPENGSYGTVRKPYRTIYPAPDESSETSGESCSAPDPIRGRRSKSKTTSRFPRSCAERRSRGGVGTRLLRGTFPRREGRIPSGACVGGGMAPGCS